MLMNLISSPNFLLATTIFVIFFFDTPQQLVAIQPQTESVTKIVRENKKKIGKKFKKQKVCYRKHFKVSSQGEKRVEELIPLNSD